MVNTPDPTDVPNELATSFAPMPNASMNAITKPMIMIHIESAAYGSNIFEIEIRVGSFDVNNCLEDRSSDHKYACALVDYNDPTIQNKSESN